MQAREGMDELINLQKVSDSLATRLILFGLTIAIITATGRYFMMADFLRQDLESVVSTQQEALVGYVARDIEHKITERMEMLKRLADILPLDLIGKPGELRTWLQTHYELLPLFSQGLFVADIDGTVIADFPQLLTRAGTNFSNSDYIRAALDGRPNIGRVAIASAEVGPVVSMAVPVKDSSGKIRAVLAGFTATAATGLFDLLQQTPIGKRGGFLIIDPKEQIFVAATEPELVMRSTAAPGVNPLHDKASKGGKGSGMTVNAKGVEEIAAYAEIPSAGWFAVARIPTAEAFLSVDRAQRYVVRNTVIMISLLVLILVVGLSYIFRPLASAADHATRMTNGELPFAPIPVVRNDEVGHLTAAFNKLLEKLLRNREEMRKMANHDPLTGLPNRLLLADRMGQAMARADRNETRLAVLYLDLDGFKQINDQMGHEAGDFALVDIAKRLSSVVREADTVSRIGGDEFVIVIADLEKDIQSAQSAGCAVAEKCIEVVAEPIQIKGERYCVGVSIGISFGDGKSSVDSLLSAADSSMYAAKQRGKGRFVVSEQLHPTSAHT